MTPVPDRRQQLRRFALAALVLAGVLLALGRSPHADPPASPALRDGLHVERPRPPRPHDRAVGASRSAPAARRAVVAAARRFATAFIAYQHGRSDRRVREALRASAAPGLRNALLAAPARLPAGRRPRRSRLASLRVLDLTPTTAYVLASLRQRGRRRQLVITLRRRGHSFVAVAVR